MKGVIIKKKQMVMLGVVVVLAGGLTYLVPALLPVPGMAASFYAREMCSCMFVSDRDEAFCLRYARQIIDPSSIQVDLQTRTVRVRVWKVEREGYYKDHRSGCGLRKVGER